jgi:non-specific serine/threonine protein kinase
MIGQTISHYQILEKLGEGGMGVVYKARDTKLDRFVALKFLSDHLHANEAEQARFLQEARAAATLNHSHVCVIHAVEDVGDARFIVMEFVEGTDLKMKIKAGRLSLDQSVEFGIAIAEGLRAAHERGIVHRDIKADNVMITSRGQLKIMDFGLAKLKGSSLTKSGTTVGTIAYMSPEQFQRDEINAQTDLWSLGVLLYEMFSGQQPFRGEHEAAIMYEVLNVDPLPVQRIRPEIPDHIQALLTHMLQKDRKNRIGSAKEVIDRLKKTPTESAAGLREKSIAVLYFENMSSEKESDYFCAGITEDIITDLSKTKQLKVISRTDVLPFRNKEINTRQVGEALGVNYVLEGSVRKAGSKIRITAQLIDVHDGFHVWADRFDRLVEDIFDLQNEVSQKIAEALKVSFNDSDQQPHPAKPTDDLRAYDFYMRGREYLNTRGKKINEQAIQMFEHALTLDPNFALAYAALAEACANMYLWYDGDPQWLGKTIEMNQKALRVQPDLQEAQFGIAMVYLYQKRFAEAKKTLERIIQKMPDSYDAVRWMGIISDIIGNYDAAVEYYQQAAKIKPYSEEPWMHLDMTFRRMGNEEASNEAAKKIIEIGARKYAVNPDDVLTLSRMAIPYARFGDREKALAAIQRVLEIAPEDGLALYNCACTYTGLSQRNEALTILRRSLEIGGNVVREWVKTDPYFDSLRGETDFETLLAEFA